MRYRRKRFYRRRRKPYGRRRYRRGYRRYHKGSRPERKHKDWTPSTSISDTWDSVSGTGSGYGMLADISAGSGGHSRIGDQIYVRRFILKGALLGGQTGVAADDAYNQVRLLLVIGPALRNIANDLIVAGVGLYSPITATTCPSIYKKLYDRVIHMKSPGFNGGTGYMPCIKHIKINKRIMRKASYIYGTTTPSRWDLYFLYVTDSAVVPHPGFQGSSRIWVTYQDN